MGKGLGQSTKNKVIKVLQNALVLTSAAMIAFLFIPIGLIGTAQKELGDRNLLGDGLMKNFWLQETFQALLISSWFAIVFLALGIFINWGACHGREENCPACPPSSMQEPEHKLRPILLLFVVFILASALLQSVMGGYISGRTPEDGPRTRWLEDSNNAEERRVAYMELEGCCGWVDIFQYQLQPECNRGELLQNPMTCRASIEQLISEFIRPVGNWCMASGILMLIPWFIMVALRVLDVKAEILDTAFSAGGEY